jgi:hypothetical protein
VIHRKLVWLLGCVLCLIAACSTAPVAPTPSGPTVTYNPFATLSPTPFLPGISLDTPIATEFLPPTTIAPTPTYLPSTTPASGSALPASYTLQVSLDYEAHSVVVDETILYKNVTGVELDTLVLAVEPALWQGCFSLTSLTGQGVGTHTLETNRLEIALEPRLVQNGSILLQLQYSLTLPPADRLHLFGYKVGQINLVDWYPFIVPYQHGWVLHPPAELGEHLVYDASDFDVTIAITDPSLALNISAGAPLVDGHFRLESARTVAISISSQQMQSSITSDGLTITGVYFVEDRLKAERLLDELGKAVATFEELFGPYPYPSLTVVESNFYDGMEFDGLFFLSRDFFKADDGTKLNYLEDIAVHETAHQWWFGWVGNDQAREPWLDEALATYSEALFYEDVYPGMAGAWWQFRVNGFSPDGAIDSEIYSFDRPQIYANAVYLRGALFLRDLRDWIGDASFLAFVKDYAFQMGGRIATKDDFFRILAQHTGADMTNLRGEYFTP